MPIGSLISGLFGTFNNQQSIEEQKKENQKAREHNLSLARLQNQWNIDQWNRENEYNSPAAQMQRFAAAGLNPDLIYGQQTTGGQISGSLTSGAPANPANIGALLASKDSNLSKAYGALGDAMMQLPMYREELRAKRLANDEKQEDIVAKRFSNDFETFLREVDPEADFQMISEKSMDLMGSLRGRQALEAWRRQKEETAEVSERVKQAVFNNRLNNASYNYYIRRLRSEANISEQEARWLMDSFTLRMSGLKSGTSMLKKSDDWFTADKIFNMSTGAINTLIDGYTSLRFGAKGNWYETYDGDGVLRKVVHRYEK